MDNRYTRIYCSWDIMQTVYNSQYDGIQWWYYQNNGMVCWVLLGIWGRYQKKGV
jgi:hypothetical protein